MALSECLVSLPICFPLTLSTAHSVLRSDYSFFKRSDRQMEKDKTMRDAAKEKKQPGFMFREYLESLK